MKTVQIHKLQWEWLDEALNNLLDHIDPYCLMDYPQISVTKEMERVNQKDRRIFAQTCMDTGEIQLAPQFFDLHPKYRYGILAHELGHVILIEDPDHTEDEADAEALEASIKILYDTDGWPGKGLQYIDLEDLSW